ncbi:hypothetical protein BN77_1631 [Rhizobium mesoamericanum STM3625]|uniref:Uncharacterized protein n=1 Tax=Rhizobium mesoamericanum STM3625 TaxID=1211777 RepID=K0PT07_9HYPH|nr:hypothetical protein BN77_1631 [Rhizobium mesoamericanum STM3625]
MDLQSRVRWEGYAKAKEETFARTSFRKLRGISWKATTRSGHDTVIDLTRVKTNDSLHQGNLAGSPEIVQLIGQRLITAQT